jgi:thioredoxin 1
MRLYDTPACGHITGESTKGTISMKPIHVTEATFENEVSQSDKPVLIDFWANWCGPCRALSPVLDEIAAENPERFKIAKVDIDQNPASPRAFEFAPFPHCCS